MGVFVVVTMIVALGAFVLGIVVGREYAHPYTVSIKPLQTCAASERTALDDDRLPGGLDGASTSRAKG
jgi:hypothetical protein